MRTFPIFVLFVGMMTGCSWVPQSQREFHQEMRDSNSPYKVVEKDDPFTETWSAAMVNNFVSVKGSAYDEWQRGYYIDVEFNLALACKHADRDTLIILGLKYYSEHWLFIGGKSSLVLLIAGERRAFSGILNTSERGVVGGGGVQENMVYLMDRRTVSLLCSPTVIRGALFGSEGQCEFTLTRENIERLRAFAARYNLI